MEIIRFAEERDISQLKEIYNICFPGEERFADFFFDTFFSKERALLCDLDFNVAGCLHMLPVVLENRGEKHCGSFVFAAGVRPEYRSRGIMRRLLERSFQEGERNSETFSSLIAGEPTLLEYYAKAGYEPKSSVTAEVMPQEGEAVNLTFSDIDMIDEIYRRFSQNLPHIIRDLSHWENHIKSYRAYGLFEGERLKAYLFGEARDGTFRVTEAIGEGADTLCAHAAFKENARKCTVIRSPDFCIKKFKPFDTENLYFNLYFN